MLRKAPPPFGRLNCGAATVNVDPRFGVDYIRRVAISLVPVNTAKADASIARRDIPVITVIVTSRVVPLQLPYLSRDAWMSWKPPLQRRAYFTALTITSSTVIFSFLARSM